MINPQRYKTATAQMLSRMLAEDGSVTLTLSVEPGSTPATDVSDEWHVGDSGVKMLRYHLNGCEITVPESSVQDGTQHYFPISELIDMWLNEVAETQ